LIQIQNGDVYTTAELPCKQITKSEDDLVDLFFVIHFKTMISCIRLSKMVASGHLGYTKMAITLQ